MTALVIFLLFILAGIIKYIPMFWFVCLLAVGYIWYSGRKNENV